MADLKNISHDLTQSLDLKYLPVGVILYKNQEQPPADIPFTVTNLKSYCQAVALAGKGSTMLLKKEQLGCKLGTSVLGFEKEVEDYLDDGVIEKYGVGLFANEEASAESILKSAYLPKGQTQAAFIAPITSFHELPQVVIFSVNSEQVMWLLYAVNYEKGGAINLPQTGGALGGCSDVTAWPLLKGQPNVTFLGLGCRLKSALNACHLMMGIPGSMLEMVHAHIKDMAKPIAMLKDAQAKS
ncbi:MAG: DUF169 domain-containing protein [Nitrospirae bacterium]|nr:DUF169 domain-containing protein [Nitrospirota bacterium]